MKIYCIEDFKLEIERLNHNNSYSDSESTIIDYFWGKQLKNVLSGSNLNNNPVKPFIKKRLEGRGGYRIYFLADPAKDAVYIAFYHPKTGSEGYESIKDDFKTHLLKKVGNLIKDQEYYELTASAAKDTLTFTKIMKIQPPVPEKKEKKHSKKKRKGKHGK